jgi:hypothetical protein
MGTRADEIRAEIERTRENLGETIDEVGDRMNPREIAKRKTARVRGRLHTAKEKVMGVADIDAEQVEERIKGNPLAAGLIAFGAGALLASLLPADRTSREAAEALAERAEPLADRAKAEAREAGEEMREDLGQSARESAEHLREQAAESAEHLREETRSAGEHLREEQHRNR